jgi:hypothetical protein
LSSKFLEGIKSKGGPDGILTLQELQRNLGGMEIYPRSGSFGADIPGSNFLFIAMDN